MLREHLSCQLFLHQTLLFQSLLTVKLAFKVTLKAAKLGLDAINLLSLHYFDWFRLPQKSVQLILSCCGFPLLVNDLQSALGLDSLLSQVLLCSFYLLMSLGPLILEYFLGERLVLKLVL